MGLLNYSTQIPKEKTIGEIENILSQHGANAILKDFDGAGNITSISFKVNTEYGEMPFKLPMNVQAAMQIINEQTEKYRGRPGHRERVVPLRYKDDLDQARRVGWRIIKDWIKAQMALIELGLVKIQQVFLPYAVTPNGKTFYEYLESQQFEQLLLPPHEDD